MLVALGCLAGLLGLIVATLEVWAWTGFPQTFDYRAYWQQVKANPADGGLLYLMLVTTLLPTILHVFVGLAGMISQRARWMEGVAQDISEWPGTYKTRDKLPLSVVHRTVSRVRRVHFWGGALTVAFPALLFLMGYLVYWVINGLWSLAV
ncbi:MAG: hypothetical protein ACWA40_08030 [Planktomarina sp.]